MPNTILPNTTFSSRLVEKLHNATCFQKGDVTEDGAVFYSYYDQEKTHDFIVLPHCLKVTLPTSLSTSVFYDFFKKVLVFIKKNPPPAQVDPTIKQMHKLLSEAGDDLLKIVDPLDPLSAERFHAFLELAALVVDIHHQYDCASSTDELVIRIAKVQEVEWRQPTISLMLPGLLLVLSGVLLIGSVLMAVSILSPVGGGFILFSSLRLAEGLVGAFIFSVGFFLSAKRIKADSYHNAIHNAMKKKMSEWDALRKQVHTKYSDIISSEKSKDGPPQDIEGFLEPSSVPVSESQDDSKTEPPPAPATEVSSAGPEVSTDLPSVGDQLISEAKEIEREITTELHHVSHELSSFFHRSLPPHYDPDLSASATAPIVTPDDEPEDPYELARALDPNDPSLPPKPGRSPPPLAAPDKRVSTLDKVEEEVEKVEHRIERAAEEAADELRKVFHLPHVHHDPHSSSATASPPTTPSRFPPIAVPIPRGPDGKLIHSAPRQNVSPGSQSTSAAVSPQRPRPHGAPPPGSHGGASVVPVSMFVINPHLSQHPPHSPPPTSVHSFVRSPAPPSYKLPSSSLRSPSRTT